MVRRGYKGRFTRDHHSQQALEDELASLREGESTLLVDVASGVLCAPFGERLSLHHSTWTFQCPHITFISLVKCNCSMSSIKRVINVVADLVEHIRSCGGLGRLN